ncbi:hypothetical protein [Salinicola sp. CR57]|uniref:hypothetical protein n=1 Tax=Salinicola sp. CR57 TaxID=1949086 RepID=UPI001E4A4720|nr:hypothetical protein [Salinicola sp. CR57]
MRPWQPRERRGEKPELSGGLLALDALAPAAAQIGGDSAGELTTAAGVEVADQW